MDSIFELLWLCLSYLATFGFQGFLICFLITFFSIKSENRIIHNLGLFYCGLFAIIAILAVIVVIVDRTEEVIAYGLTITLIGAMSFFASLAGYGLARAIRKIQQ